MQEDIADLHSAAADLATDPGNAELRGRLCSSIASEVRFAAAARTKSLRQEGWATNDLQDVVQEAFLNTFRVSIARCEAARGLGRDAPAYCHGVFNNCLRVALRKLRRMRSKLPRQPLPPDPVDGRSPSVESVMESKEARERLRRAIATLPENHRKVVLLYCSGSSTRRIAVDLGVSEEVVRSRLSRAIQSLRKVI